MNKEEKVMFNNLQGYLLGIEKQIKRLADLFELMTMNKEEKAMFSNLQGYLLSIEKQIKRLADLFELWHKEKRGF